MGERGVYRYPKVLEPGGGGEVMGVEGHCKLQFVYLDQFQDFLQYLEPCSFFGALRGNAGCGQWALCSPVTKLDGQPALYCTAACFPPCSVQCAITCCRNLFGEAPSRFSPFSHFFSSPTHSKSINRNLPAQFRTLNINAHFLEPTPNEIEG